MIPRERVYTVLDFNAPDIVPLECHRSEAGLYEHGEKLKELWKRHPQDFGDLLDIPIPSPDPANLDINGSYRALRTDIWGVAWEELMFGALGHPIERPLDDLADLAGYKPPEPPVAHGPLFEDERAASKKHMEKYFLRNGWISIFEKMHALCRFETVLAELALDTTEINRLADMICEYQEAEIRYLLACGADAIQFGDDFGTQSGLLISESLWRRFFKPRYLRLMAPVKEAGAKIFFHSCGNVWQLLPDLADLGVHAIWPQLDCYDRPALAARCLGLHLAIALQPQRSHLMTYGTPEEIGAEVRRIAETFRVEDGGAWFHIEIDSGFPYENVQSLFDAVHEYRR